MRIVRMIMVAAAAVLAMLAVGVPLANAAGDDCPHRMGSSQRLGGADGGAVQEWTISGLRKSTDAIPGYPVAGQLWEATASVRAVEGAVTPIIPNIAAVSGSDEHYRALWQVASPNGISGATLAPGQSSGGKVYFDVAGAAPAMVTYQDGAAMPAMMWCEDAAMKAMVDKMKAKADTDCTCCADKSGEDCPCCTDKP